MIEQIDFHISYRCPNKCIFCSSADVIARYRNRPLKIEDIIAKIREKRGEGFKKINFTGGEPTVFTSFACLAKEAKRLGYRVYVGTNGGRFADTKFCAGTASFLDEVCFSCHGHTAALHDRLAASKGAFVRLTKAMDNLAGFPISFSSNTVITRYNIDHLDKIMDILIGRKIKHILISNVAPEGRGLKNLSRIAVTLTKIREKIPSLASIADKNDTVVRFFGIPACILGDFACRSNDFCWDTRLNIEQDNDGRSFLKEEVCALPVRGRIKTARCRGCLYEHVCGGIFKAYFERFGDDELNTVGK